MNQTGEIRKYCNNHKGGLFDLGYLSKTIFKDISLANLRKYVTRLVEVGMLHQISIFYNNSSWSYTKLDHMNLRKTEFQDLLDIDAIVITFKLK